jgi:predicted nucleotidyltransferase component of viral defense system
MSDQGRIDETLFTETERDRVRFMNIMAQELTKNEKGGLILKGGTGLLLCYQLPRFSVDLDYDGKDLSFDFEGDIRRGAERGGKGIRDVILKKDTDTVKRYMVHIDGWENKPLKIEISSRDRDSIRSDDYEVIKGIRVYRIENMINKKLDAFCDRCRGRDVFDVAFLVHYYGDRMGTDLLKKGHEGIKKFGLDYLEKVMKEDALVKKYDCEKIVLSMDNDFVRLREKKAEEKEKRENGRHGLGR